MKTKFVTFYNPKQVLTDNIEKSATKSPLKPKLVVEELIRVLGNKMEVKDFEPYVFEDFLIAHTENYVEHIFDSRNKSGMILESQVPWSENLVESLTYTNACLYNAIKHSVDTNDLVLAPVSGFHHAQPDNGLGFCTFSGQVIASVKLYKERKLRGCYIDLDGHFGNSIEDTRRFTPVLNKAVPDGFNFNPNGKFSIQRTNQDYVEYVRKFLYEDLLWAFVNDQIDYVVWCHGADSHEDDDYPGQVNTTEWLQCSEIFFGWVKWMKEKNNIEVPVTMCLFGGYRNDDYHSVVSLHCAEMIMGINELTSDHVDYEVKYNPHPREFDRFIQNTSMIENKSDQFVVIHNKFKELLDVQDFIRVKNLMYRYNQFGDVGTLKTILIITKSFKEHPILKDIRKETLNILETKLGHKII